MKKCKIVVYLGLVLVFFSGCGKEKPKPIHVSAASSLTETLEELKLEYIKQTGADIQLNFGASSVLTTQIELGADVDIFLSADFDHFDQLSKAQYIQSGNKICENTICLVVSNDNTSINSVEDMAGKGTKIIFASDDVPIGTYTNIILDNYSQVLGAEFKELVKANVVSKEENVRQVLSKIALGEGDCGLVYQTDITDDVKDKVHVVAIDERHNIKGEYWGGILKKEQTNKTAEDFFEYINSQEGKEIFIKHGFEKE